MDLTAENLLQRSELTHFSINDFKKKLVSENHGPPIEFCELCCSGDPCMRQHTILTSSQLRRNVEEWEDLNLVPNLGVLQQIKSNWTSFEVIKLYYFKSNIYYLFTADSHELQFQETMKMTGGTGTYVALQWDFGKGKPFRICTPPKKKINLLVICDQF